MHAEAWGHEDPSAATRSSSGSRSAGPMTAPLVRPRRAPGSSQLPRRSLQGPLPRYDRSGQWRIGSNGRPTPSVMAEAEEEFMVPGYARLLAPWG